MAVVVLYRCQPLTVAIGLYSVYQALWPWRHWRQYKMILGDVGKSFMVFCEYQDDEAIMANTCIHMRNS